jgi:hypothetical protein
MATKTYIGNADSSRITLLADDSLKTITSQFKVAYLKTAGMAALCTSAADKVLGLVESYQSASSETVTIIYDGLARGYNLASTMCAAGDFLAPAALGTLVPYITNTTAQVIVGMAIDPGTTSGAITVLVGRNPYGIKS